jgi:hypothetical protein
MLVISLALFFLPASRARSIDNACSLILISLCLDTILEFLFDGLVLAGSGDARVKSSPCNASLDWKIAVRGLPCLRAARLPDTIDFTFLLITVVHPPSSYSNPFLDATSRLHRSHIARSKSKPFLFATRFCSRSAQFSANRVSCNPKNFGKHSRQ